MSVNHESSELPRAKRCEIVGMGRPRVEAQPFETREATEGLRIDQGLLLPPGRDEDQLAELRQIAGNANGSDAGDRIDVAREHV